MKQESVFKAEKNWGFAEVWNQSLLEQEKRPVVARDHLWASELGRAPIELFLKLKGVEPTNPPNARSLRKFEAGGLFEWVVSLILKRAGILQETQKWVSHAYPGLLEVTGKIDFIAGGMPDYEGADKFMKEIGLPTFFTRAGEKILDYFKNFYPEGLREKPLEIKSVSAFMFEGLSKRNKGSKAHRMQLYHYLKSCPYDMGTIIYICRDDLRMMEIDIHNPSEVENEYKSAIEEISKYYKKDEQPPLEAPILFDEDILAFSKNWNVAYSNYLTMLYGLKDQKEFDDKYQPMTERWNRLLRRMVEEKKMTDKNLESVAEIETAGFNLKEIINKIKEYDKTSHIEDGDGQASTD